MKLKSLLLGVIALFAVGGITNLVAQVAPQQPSAEAQTWFKIGYEFDRTANPKEIALLRTALPGTPPATLIQMMTNWEKGAVKKDEVRPHLVAYAKASGGYLTLESFRLGEWCSRLEDATFEFMIGIVTDDHEKWVTAMNKIMVLGAQSQGFIDALSEDVPATVVEALKNIDTAGKKANMVDIYFDRVSFAELGEAVMSLPDLIQTIQMTYGIK
ncbi:MAG: hypothetical protein H5U03_03690 [Clostridia bacterium]|nr:hypothetical protein [Clostridia bacterium]